MGTWKLEKPPPPTPPACARRAVLAGWPPALHLLEHQEAPGGTLQAGFQTQASPVSGICSANNEMNGALILSGLWATNMSSLWNIPGDRWASAAFRGYLTRR